jgi:putative addiction module component (TIGR02574 family)
MDIQSVKIDLIHWLTQLQDITILEKIQALRVDDDNDLDLSPEQQRELDRRLEKLASGEAKFVSWDEAEARIRGSLKNVL